MKHKNVVLIISLLFVFSCKNKEIETNAENEAREVNQELHHQIETEHWTYEGERGPEHWAEIEKDSDCDGKFQSPINIIDIDAVIDHSLKPIDIHYSSNVKIHDVLNNGFTIQYDFEKGDYINIGEKKYELKQIHFHEASEHTINGIRYPLEIHMVHVSNDKKIAVLAVLAQEGKSSEPFTFLEKYLPVKKGEIKTIDAYFDLNLNLPDNKTYYTYSGSLTTPPCTENVSWYIFKTPITVSVDQVKQLQLLMPLSNYRNEQPLNGRIVKQNNGI
jgi:carbonic anhydrase